VPCVDRFQTASTQCSCLYINTHIHTHKLIHFQPYSCYQSKHQEYRTARGYSFSLVRPWARRWINHSRLWCMASAIPDQWLPSQSQDIPVLRPVLLGDRHTRVWTTCPRWTARSRTCNLLSRKLNALTITPLGQHTPARDQCGGALDETAVRPPVCLSSSCLQLKHGAIYSNGYNKH